MTGAKPSGPETHRAADHPARIQDGRHRRLGNPVLKVTDRAVVVQVRRQMGQHPRVRGLLVQQEHQTIGPPHLFGQDGAHRLAQCQVTADAGPAGIQRPDMRLIGVDQFNRPTSLRHQGADNRAQRARADDRRARHGRVTGAAVSVWRWMRSATVRVEGLTSGSK